MGFSLSVHDKGPFPFFSHTLIGNHQFSLGDMAQFICSHINLYFSILIIINLHNFSSIFRYWEICLNIYLLVLKMTEYAKNGKSTKGRN